MSADRVTLRAYVRALEKALSEAMDRPVVLSSRDWHLASGWHGKGIPLGLVLEAMKSSGKRGARSLAYIAPRVEESWKVVMAGRISGSTGRDPGETDTHSARTAWRQAADRFPAGSAMRSLLERLLEELAAGADPEEVDGALDMAIVEASPADLLIEIRGQAVQALETHRSRMDSDVYRTTLHRSTADRLRKRLLLPRLDS